MHQKRIAVFVGKKTLADFLDRFFRDRKMFRPQAFETAEKLLRGADRQPPAALVVEDSLLPLVSHRFTKIPVIMLIAGKKDRGIQTAIAHHADSYLSKPFLEAELLHAIESTILEKDSLEAMRREIRELEAIAELTRLISSTLDPKEILFRVVHRIADIMPVSRCSIIRVDWLKKSAFVVASHEDPNIGGIRLNLRKYPEILEALTSRHPVFVRDVSTDPRMQKVKDLLAPLGIRSILVIPIMMQERVIGTLFLRTSRRSHTFTGSEIRLLNTFAHSSANALHNAFLFEQVEDEKTRLEKLAITDYLTGIYNIRYFYHRIIEEFSRAQRHGLPLSCLMLDIDFFKKINDTYGHKTGDLVLREFAQQVKKLSRKSDVAARYGGEEFIVLLPQTSLAGAIAEAERIRTFLKDYRFRSLKNRTGVTVSIGISSFPHPRIKTHDDLISFADDGLFRAKEAGRDRAVVAE